MSQLATLRQIRRCDMTCCGVAQLISQIECSV